MKKLKITNKQIKRKLYHALHKYNKAIKKYEQQTGIKITSHNYSAIMWIKDHKNTFMYIRNPDIPRYLTKADDNLLDVEDDCDIIIMNNRNRKQRKNDYIRRVHTFNVNNYENSIDILRSFEQHKREVYDLFMKNKRIYK